VSQERLERFEVVCATAMCEYAPSGVRGTLCRFFPKNGIENLVELVVGLEKPVEVAVIVVVARSIVSVSEVFADSEDEPDGE
jgi:hypothetical protein